MVKSSVPVGGRRAILCVLFVMSHSCSGFLGTASQNVERIQTCSTKCSKGLHCRTKQALPSDWFPPPCKKFPQGLDASSVLGNVSLSTVMRCEGRQKCSLHLRFKTSLQLSEPIQGLSVCTTTVGWMASCRTFAFSASSRAKMSGQRVEVENDCAVVSPDQRVRVTVATVPNYCGVGFSGAHEVPACANEDLRRNVPECITGRLSYRLKPDTKELSVTVSDMLEDRDYILRLCRKDFVCSGSGAITTIKKEEKVKTADLRYSWPVPCLCIEGWSAVTDAPRVQLCPFKDRTEELWRGIVFDPLEEALWWESACPLPAASTVALCQRAEGGACLDLPASSRNVSRGKITFTRVDPHPQLCVKFTVSLQSWVKCPFADRTLQVWQVALSEGQEAIKMSSQISGSFSVGLCQRSGEWPACRTTEARSVHVEKQKSVVLNLGTELCKANTCLQVRRLNVEYAATVIECFEQCAPSLRDEPLAATQATWELTWVIIPAGVCLSAIIIVTLVLHGLLTVHQRMKKRSASFGVSKNKPDSLDCVISTFQHAHHGGVLIPAAQQSDNTEKANLLSH